MKILILGIGNIMFADEGIGVHFVNMIEKKYSLSSSSHTIDFVDGGTLAHRLIPIIVEYDYVIIVDCIDADESKVGEVYFFDYENVPDFINWQGSAHELEMLQTLCMIDMVGDRPTTKILGVIPKRIEATTLDLSDEILESAKLMERVFIDHLKSLDITCEKMCEIDLQELANETYKDMYPCC